MHLSGTFDAQMMDASLLTVRHVCDKDKAISVCVWGFYTFVYSVFHFNHTPSCQLYNEAKSLISSKIFTDADYNRDAGVDINRMLNDVFKSHLKASVCIFIQKEPVFSEVAVIYLPSARDRNPTTSPHTTTLVYQLSDWHFKGFGVSFFQNSFSSFRAFTLTYFTFYSVYCCFPFIFFLFLSIKQLLHASVSIVWTPLSPEISGSCMCMQYVL